MNVSFTEKQEKYIKEQVVSGDYQNASEVVRDALRLHQTYRLQALQSLRNEILKGWNDEPLNQKMPELLEELKSKYAAKNV